MIYDGTVAGFLWRLVRRTEQVWGDWEPEYLWQSGWSHGRISLLSYSHPLIETGGLNNVVMYSVQVGNVYVQFREEEQAANALKNLTGRFYAGKFLFLRAISDIKYLNGGERRTCHVWICIIGSRGITRPNQECSIEHPSL